VENVANIEERLLGEGTAEFGRKENRGRKEKIAKFQRRNVSKVNGSANVHLTQRRVSYFLDLEKGTDNGRYRGKHAERFFRIQ